MIKAFNITHNTIIAFIVSLALFMEALDTTIINTAIPAMARSLQVSPVDLKVALISYLISLAIFIPVSGWVGEKFGVKRVFMTAILIFTLSSIWCGVSRTLTQLVVARSCQGLGGSMMMPLGRLIVLRTFKRHQLIETMNAIVTVVSVGLMLGPVAGGFITDHLSWKWIFWVNIPIGLFAIVMASLYLPEMPARKVEPLDLPGFILFGGGLAGLTFSFSRFSESADNFEKAMMIMLVSLGMLISYFIYSRYQKHPIIDSTLFRIRTFRVSIMGNLLARIGFGGVPFLLPLLFQVVMHYSAQKSGFLIMPMAVGIFFVRTVSLHALRFFGYKRLLIMNTVVLALIISLFQFINVNTPLFVIMFFIFLFGFFISLTFSSMNSLGYADIPSDQLSSATSIASTVQQISQSFGVGTSALLLHLYTSQRGEQMLLDQPAFAHTFLTMGLILLVSILVLLQLQPKDGHQLLSQNKN